MQQACPIVDSIPHKCLCITIHLQVTFLEIYNEIIKDLLNPSDKQLKIRENPESGIYVEDLCELVSNNPSSCVVLT